jgi:hypothetical protein
VIRGDRDRASEFLWDRSGPAELELERLERRLRPFALRPGPEPDWSGVGARRAVAARRRRVLLRLAAALAAVAIGGGAWLASHLVAPAWHVETIAGAPAIDGRAVGARGTLRPGQTLATGDGARVRLGVSWLGTVEVEPGSRVRLLRAGANEQRMALDRGTIQATISAPPRWFAVATPAAEAIDLGCAYTLSVDETGEGHLAVTSGWVALVHGGLESLVPRGARAPILAGGGPGTPLWEDAPAALADAVARLDRLAPAEPARAALLATALAAARPRDGLTLWHLLVRTPASERPAIAARLAELEPPPSAAVLDAAIAGRRVALDAWWGRLGLGPSSWWRLWRQPTPTLSASGA